MMKLFGLLAAVAIFTYFYERKTGLFWSILITAAYSVPAAFFYYSEGPNPLHLYTLLSFLSLWRLDVFISSRSRIIRNGLIASALCALCFFCKGNGLALIAAGYAILIMHRDGRPEENRRKAILFISITLIALIIWFGRSSLAPGPKESGYGYSYVSEFFMKNMQTPYEGARANISDLIMRISDNAVFYARDLVVPGGNVYIVLAQVYLLLCGLVAAFKRNAGILALYWLFYLLILLVFVSNGTRMYLPIRPLSAYLVMLGLLAHWERLVAACGRRAIPLPRGPYKSPAFIALSVLVLTVSSAGFGNVAKIEYCYEHRPQPFLDFMQACDVIKSRVGPDDACYSSIAPAFFLYTGMRASYPPFTRDNNKILQRIRRDRVKYVALQTWGNAYAYKTIYPFITANPQYFEKIYENTTCKIYKIVSI